jgi:hypothetical protein
MNRSPKAAACVMIVGAGCFWVARVGENFVFIFN